MCALARGPGGGHGGNARAACPLRARRGPVDRWTRRESVGACARRLPAPGSGRPLRASCGCSGFSLQRGWKVGPFFFFLFARLCVCVCAKSLYLGGERWALAAGGEPSGRRRGGRRALPAAGEVATLSAVPAFIKERSARGGWRQLFLFWPGVSAARGGGSWGGPGARQGSRGLRESGSPSVLDSGPRTELGEPTRPAPRAGHQGQVRDPRGCWGWDVARARARSRSPRPA